jgi:hypothetical protein
MYLRLGKVHAGTQQMMEREKVATKQSQQNV